MIVRTKHGDTVDSLLWKHLKRNDEEVTSAFWLLNSHAAELGPIFNIGVNLELPDLTTQPITEQVSPWD
jgi:phage tail protein X